jgi:hypothetical protein
MGLLGDFTKGFAILTGVLWVFAIIGSILNGQIVFTLLLLIVLMIPLSMIALEYLRNRKKEREQTVTK